MRLLPILLAVTLAGLTACVPVVSLTYRPTYAVVPGPPALLAAVTITDMRGSGPYYEPNALLTIPGMNGFMPIARTRRAVADEVAAVFTRALQVRGMTATAAPYRMQLTLRRLDGDNNRNIGNYGAPVIDLYSATIDVDLAVTDQSGRILYQDTVRDVRELRASPAARDDGTLPTLAQALLSATADHMLDKPAFRRAVQPR